MVNIWEMSAAVSFPGGNGDKRFFRKKTICSILLLINATCCVSGAFEVSVTQSSYQAEENQNITLEWRFTTKPGSSFKYLSVLCLLLTERKAPALYHLHESVEVPESQDKQFAGRVQCDKDALKDGRIRLLVSGLRTDDSGLYLCKVNTDYGMDTGTCQLNVTVAERPRMRQEPENLGRPIIYAGMGVTAATVLVLFAKIYCGSFSSRDCDSPESWFRTCTTKPE
ncbi:CD276 antigen-like isoform X2 [Chaetodon auriga]|uniref:CD276 antigen-like isoform X2 n=1 Tax=Chaetodon auriga TaxID=39042 RepID=UPI004032FBA2